MRFAERTNFEAEETLSSEALTQARKLGQLIDLTVSNPTRCDFPAQPQLLAALSNVEALRYDADPQGRASTREVVAAHYGAGGCTVTSADMVLTASTSEAYGYLLKLLCEPGDAILVPSPSYPLFDLLARLHDVDLLTYPLVYHDGWQIDEASLRAAITERVRAIVVIHPNNPTGHYCSREDRRVLLQCARDYDLPLMVDEVFLEYPVEGDQPQSFAHVHEDGLQAPLLFVLGGVSKLLCLPQMKLAWMLVLGTAGYREQALGRLQVIADTFLSVSTPTQLALRAWLPAGEAIRAVLLDRIKENLARLDVLLAGTSVTRLLLEAGWTAVLRVPALEPDHALATRLLLEHATAVHPGSLYGFSPRGWLVVSLITPPDLFQAGIGRVLQAIGTS